jgi:hypothetical protein
MMQKSFFLLFSVLIATQAKSQTIQEIATGAGYQKQSYLQLATGIEKQVTNTAWDIAFSVFGQQDAAVFVNESSGSSMGQSLPQVELYDALTDNFEEVLDPTLLTDFRLFNSEKSWLYGAFNERRDTLNAFDFGWGSYNFQTNQVVGNAVYLIKLPNGQYRKLKIESLAGTTYTFTYANLDGTGLQTKTINKTDHAGKTLAYFNLQTGNTVDVEPTTGGFDLLYCRYSTHLFDPGTMAFISYNVTGIINGRGVKAAKADGVNPSTVSYADYQNKLLPNLDVIGHDWKSFSGASWTVDADRVFFLKTSDNRVWKLYFIDFEGSTTGKAVFEKTDLGVISPVLNPALPGLEAVLYPNPVQDLLTIALDIPGNVAPNAQLEVVDIQGRLLVQQPIALHQGFQVLQVPSSSWMPGTHMVRIVTAGTEIKLGKIIK